MGNSLLEELQKYECAYQQALNKAPERRHFAAGPLYTPQDLADSIRLGEAWRRLVEDAAYDEAMLEPLHFLPPDEPT